MLNQKPKDELGKEYVFQKLGKSLVASKDLDIGEELTFSNLSGTIFSEQYTPVRDSYKLIGKKINKSIKKGEPIFIKDLI